MMISLELFRTYCAYIVKKSQDKQIDHQIRQEYNRGEWKETVESVWAVNKFRGEASRRLFDVAMHGNSDVLAILRGVKEITRMKCASLNGRNKCCVSLDDVDHCKAITVGEEKRCYHVRSDIATMIRYYHLFCWYPAYLTALYLEEGSIDEEKEYKILLLVRQAMIKTIQAHILT